MYEGINERNLGCRANLEDNGSGKPLIPVCMGAAAISGAEANVIGCNNPEVCVGKLNVRPSHILLTLMSKPEPGLVQNVYEVIRG